ncbi:MAG: tRNA (adenosine(37)-N6)-dimethylallyltransferase MiaA [Rickettsiales bacterium]
MRLLAVLFGPTASGKSALALRFAQERDVVIINADSKQVYRDIPVLTAQPSLGETLRVPHRLYGHISVTERYDVARWATEAAKEIERCFSEGKTPLLVGGTGMYVDALLRGASPAPAAPEAVTLELRTLAQECGAAHVHALLRICDPTSAARISPSDAPRLIRAYGVYLAGGVPLSEWNARPRVQFLPDDVRFLIFTLERDKATLYARVETRFDAMMQGKAMEEARLYRELCAEANVSPAAKAHGLPELLAHLNGRMELSEAISLAKRNTRRYVKRQFTWMRHQLPDRIALTSFDDAECVKIIETTLEPVAN